MGHMDTLDFTGSDFMLDAEELTAGLLADLLDCATPGQDAAPAVEYVTDNYTVTCNPEDCRKYLASYGAWEGGELADHKENLKRLVWLTGCGLREGETVYFSTYG